MNTWEWLVAATVALGTFIIYLAIYPPAEDKEQIPMSASIFNRPPPPQPQASVTKDGKKYATVWPNVPDKYRKCEDGGRHSGSLEIVTWETPTDQYTHEPMGWGGVILEEAADLKKKFEEELNCDFEKLYQDWERAFRWTCCGQPGDYKWGCDHHFYPGCKCDNCKYGYKLPRGFVAERNASQHAKGLTLGEGNVNGNDFD